jgi:hypothetical protein
MAQIIKFTIIFLVLSSFASCRNFQEVSSSVPNKNDKEILGSWNLKTISGNSPDKLNIKSCKIEFSEDGKWNYSVKMTRQYEGMELEGSGTYKTNSNAFEYTAGENSGKSEIEIKDDLLMLSPDPVIKPNGGKVAAKTVYERLK